MATLTITAARSIRNIENTQHHQLLMTSHPLAWPLDSGVISPNLYLARASVLSRPRVAIHPKRLRNRLGESVRDVAVSPPAYPRTGAGNAAGSRGVCVKVSTRMVDGKWVIFSVESSMVVCRKNFDVWIMIMFNWFISLLDSGKIVDSVKMFV